MEVRHLLQAVKGEGGENAEVVESMWGSGM